MGHQMNHSRTQLLSGPTLLTTRYNRTASPWLHSHIDLISESPKKYILDVTSCKANEQGTQFASLFPPICFFGVNF